MIYLAIILLNQVPIINFHICYVLCCPVSVPHTKGGFRAVGPLIVIWSLLSHLPAPVMGILSLPPSLASATWDPLPGPNSTVFVDRTKWISINIIYIYIYIYIIPRSVTLLIEEYIFRQTLHTTEMVANLT